MSRRACATNEQAVRPPSLIWQASSLIWQDGLELELTAANATGFVGRLTVRLNASDLGHADGFAPDGDLVHASLRCRNTHHLEATATTARSLAWTGTAVEPGMRSDSPRMRLEEPPMSPQ